MSYPLYIPHTPIVLSSDPEAKYSPSGENTTLQTQLECPLRVLMSYPLYTLHTPISIKDPEAKYSPSGENTTLLTELECPLKVLMSYPLKSIFFFSSSLKYSLSAAPPKLYRPLPNKTYFFFPPTSPVLIISSISSIFSFSSSQTLLMSSFVFFSIS